MSLWTFSGGLSSAGPDNILGSQQTVPPTAQPNSIQLEPGGLVYGFASGLPLPRVPFPRVPSGAEALIQPTGWRCPGCQRCYAPWISRCQDGGPAAREAP